MIKYVFIFKLNMLNYLYLSCHLPELLKRLYLPNKRKEKRNIRSGSYLGVNSRLMVDSCF